LKATWTTPITVDGSSVDITVNSLSGIKFDESITGITPLRVTSVTPKVCIVERAEYIGSATSHTKALVKALWNGTCQLNVTYAGNISLSASTSTISTSISGITVPQPGAAAAQSIGFSAQSTATFGTKVQLTAKATSSLAVVITTTTPSACTLTEGAEGAYSVTSAEGLQGDDNICILQANQSGDTRWSPAPMVTRSIRWTRIPQSITFNLPASRFYGGAPTILRATSTSGLPVTFTTNTPAICKIEIVESQSVLNYVLPLPSASSGYCYVIASQPGNGTFGPATTSIRGISFRKESTSIIGVWSAPITAGGTVLDLVVKSAAQPSLSESLAGDTPLVITSTTPNICKVVDVKFVGTAISHTKATIKAMWNGNCKLVATFAGNGYWLASSWPISRGVIGMTTPEPGANVPQSLSIVAPSTTEIGAVTPISAPAGSKLPVTLTSLTPNICTVSTTASAFAVTSAAGVVGSGNICTIEASQAGDDRWAAAKTITQNIMINKASISVRLSRLSTMIVGKTSALFVIENRFINSSMNNGRNSIGHISTVVTTTPGVCNVSNVAPYVVASGTYTQATVTGVTNGICSITYGYEGSETRKPAYGTQSILVTGVK
jgi:hypothetical protein